MQHEESVLKRILSRFRVTGSYSKGAPYGSGHINDTYKIVTAESGAPDYILQRINHHVFRDVAGLQQNITRVTGHLARRLEREGLPGRERRILTLIPSIDGFSYYHDPGTGYWRCYLFIPGHRCYDRARNAGHAHEAGKILGQFELWLSDMDPGLLTETIPGFHDMGLRLRQLDEAITADPAHRVGQITAELDFVRERAATMVRIQKAGESGKIPLRITHNDTKFNNIFLDEEDRGLCVIDLDTVMPGYVHYDFGDALRTLSNPAAEDERDLSKVRFNLEYYEAFSKGFLSVARTFLTKEETDLLAFSARAMTYIIGLRFLTDYINGDPYFKIHRPDHNLDRARVQFRLVHEMETSADKMEKIIRDNL